jgi:hypothetical protein
MGEKDGMIVAVAWYRAEEWADLKRVCSELDDTYEEWLAGAESAIESLGSSFDVVKTILTVEELKRWKRATGREVTRKVRSQLASKIAQREAARDK